MTIHIAYLLSFKIRRCHLHFHTNLQLAQIAITYKGNYFLQLVYLIFRKKIYAPRDTMLSKAFPIPKSSAIPLRVGIHTFVL